MEAFSTICLETRWTPSKRKCASYPAFQINEVGARYRRMVSLEWSVLLSSLAPEASLDYVRLVQGTEP